MVSYVEHRRDFAQALRDLRQHRDLTGQIVSGRTGISKSKLSKVECGSLLPSQQEVESLCAVYKASAATQNDLLSRLATLRNDAGPWRVEPRAGAIPFLILEAERTARDIREFCPFFLPYALQNQAYTDAALSTFAQPAGINLETTAEQQSLRGQAIKDPTRKIRFLISELALRPQFCAAGILRLQLARLADTMSDRTNVEIGIFSADTPPTNPFTLYDNDLALTETRHTSVLANEARDIQLYRAFFDQVFDTALRGEKAISAVQHRLSELQFKPSVPVQQRQPVWARLPQEAMI